MSKKKSKKRKRGHLPIPNAGEMNGMKAASGQNLVAHFQSMQVNLPCPPPGLLRQYAEIDPTFPNRMLTMAEKQQDHRISIEKSVIASQVKSSYYGMWRGFFIGGAGLMASVAIARYGHGAAAAVVGGSTLFGLVRVFVLGRGEQSKDLATKRESTGSR